MTEIVLIMGSPGSGKSTVASSYKGTILNRDLIGGKIKSLVGLAKKELECDRSIVLDNTFPTIESRFPFIELAKEKNIKIHCKFIRINNFDAEFNVIKRMINHHGKLLMPEEIATLRDPQALPPVALFSFYKKLQEPSFSEGFDSIEIIEGKRFLPSGDGRALILDFDGTLRRTKNGSNYPTNPEDVEILPNRKEKIAQYVDKGYMLFGVSNQSGIHKGLVSDDIAKQCFERTNKLLGFNINYRYCPHNKFPISCYCRKPMIGFAVELIINHGLDPSKCIFVGDMTSDQTFATRAGFKFRHADDFFREE